MVERLAENVERPPPADKGGGDAPDGGPARVTPWHGTSVIIAGLALTALLFTIDVLWVVLAGAGISALVMPGRL